jgi:hypothetical protein
LRSRNIGKQTAFPRSGVIHSSLAAATVNRFAGGARVRRPSRRSPHGRRQVNEPHVGDPDPRICAALSLRSATTPPSRDAGGRGRFFMRIAKQKGRLLCVQTHSKASLNGWPLTHRWSPRRPCGTHPARGRPVSQGLARTLTEQFGVQVVCQGDNAWTDGRQIVLPSVPEPIADGLERMMLATWITCAV